MIDETVCDWFRLINSKGIGPKTFWNLIKSHKTAANALKAIANPFSLTEANKILSNLNCSIILASDELFPKQLKRLDNCPPILFYKGDINLLSKRKISIIGSRSASVSGRTFAFRLAKNLANENFIIVSGLARGIDANAHFGALKEGHPVIAVMPFSIDYIYPQENSILYNEIAKTGLILSEVPPGKAPDNGMFLARNRIIAAISEAVIVIEAAMKSGTLATAKMALDLGVDVLAVPGAPIDPRSRGTNWLIKNGAPLIESHYDVLNIINETQYLPRQIVEVEEPEDINHSLEKEINYIDTKQKLLTALSSEPINIEFLSSYLKIPTHELLIIISELEIESKIIKNPNNEVCLKY